MLASRTARRRGILFTALLAVTLFLMAFSSSPVVLELQRGVNFAFRPIQGALDQVAGGISSMLGALAEIDRLRVDNGRLLQENDRLAVENVRLEEIRRENELLTGLLQLRNGYEYETLAAQVIARESSEFRQLVTLSKGTDEGIEDGDIVIAQGGALAGRVVEVGPNYAKVLLIIDTGSTVIGQLPSAATGEVVGQLNGVLIMGRIEFDGAGRPGFGGGHGRHRPGWRRPIALPQGPPDRPGHRRPAGRQRDRPDRLPAARRAARSAGVRAGDHQLRGRPAAAGRGAGALRPGR